MGNRILYLYTDLDTYENDDTDFEQLYDFGEEDEVCRLSQILPMVQAYRYTRASANVITSVLPWIFTPDFQWNAYKLHSCGTSRNVVI